MREYAPKVQEGTTAAWFTWQKYMPEALAELNRRLRFEPSVKPDDIPIPPNGQFITTALYV